MSRDARLLVFAWVAGCATEKRAEIPTQPPQTLAVIADQAAPGAPGSADQEVVGFPAAQAPLRKGPCGIALGVSPEALMRPGGVELVQQRLVEEGLLRAPFDRDELDAPTLAAISALQSREDLPVVGLPSYATVRALDLDLDRVFITGDASCTRRVGRR